MNLSAGRAGCAARGIFLSTLALCLAGPAVFVRAEVPHEFFATVDLRTDYLAPRNSPADQLLWGRAETVLNGRVWLDDGEVVGRGFVWLDADGGRPRLLLEQGYFRLYPAERWEISLGRQRINWGAGYTYSVTDALHPRGVEGDRRTGFDGMALILYPAPGLSLTAALAFQDAFAETSGDAPQALRPALYGSWYSGNLELGVSAVYQYETILRPGLSASFVAAGALVSAEFAVELNNRIPYPESGFDETLARALLEKESPGDDELAAAGISIPGFGEPFPLLSVAVEYSLVGDDLSATVVGEYLFNGMGYSRSAWDRLLPLVQETTLHQAASGFATEPFAQGSAFGPRDGAGYIGTAKRHYLFVTLSLSFRDDATTSHRVLVSLTDGSLLLGHDLILTRFDRVDLGAEVGWTAGGTSSEFGILPFHVTSALFARLHL